MFKSMVGYRRIPGLSIRSIRSYRAARESPIRSVIENSSPSHHRTTQLKFNPQDKSTDFTSFGLLPFIQANINRVFGVVKSGDIPKKNVGPTEDQRLILSVLSSHHSVVHRGGHSQSGKSFAMAAYAMNYSLTRMPNYGALSRQQKSVDSVILVPTAKAVEEYRKYFAQLTVGIPSSCCPDRIEDDKVSHRPLVIEYLKGDKTEVYVSGTNEDSNAIPHILVCTPEKFHQILTENADFATTVKRSNVHEVRFLGVDNMNWMMNSTSVAGEDNFTVHGKKGKYVGLLQRVVQELNDLQITSYSKGLADRLRWTERKWKVTNTDKELDSFDHCKFMLENSSPTLVPEEIPPQANHVLLKRLLKAKRQVLYKPIQYSFICEPQNPFHQALMRLNSSEQVDEALQKINEEVNNLEQVRFKSTTNELSTNYREYLLEKSASIMKRSVDPQVEFVEKLIRFDDSKRIFRNQERKLVTVGAFPVVEQRHKFSLIQYQSGKIRDINMTKNIPNKADTVKMFVREINVTNHNLKNFHKMYLKQKFAQRLLSNDTTQIFTRIKKTIDQFRIHNPDNHEAFVVVVPSYIKRDSITDARFTWIGDETSSAENTKHTVAYADDLIGSKLPSKNLMVYSTDSLIPQLAVSKYTKESFKNISGIDSPMADLFYFYLLRMSPESQGHLVVVSDSSASLDLQRLAHIVLYNNIQDDVESVHIFPSNKLEVDLSYELTNEMVEENAKTLVKATAKIKKLKS
ncbi:hypothetical protein CAAN1_20S02542 [[Candida] anglica]|uniref:RNA helicase n=1 Tax=[Candida] anglica TaxID=148631 RepID=A0ABP0EK52_9ASCO